MRRRRARRLAHVVDEHFFARSVNYDDAHAHVDRGQLLLTVDTIMQRLVSSQEKNIPKREYRNLYQNKISIMQWSMFLDSELNFSDIFPGITLNASTFNKGKFPKNHSIIELFH